ncbi:hypothetical protein HanIR_Chr11g0549631 [Helianthus annuus]|nr:hypothetical protein HanIR_Chr11g0549631 [Helianthus annuus]
MLSGRWWTKGGGGCEWWRIGWRRMWRKLNLGRRGELEFEYRVYPRVPMRVRWWWTMVVYGYRV